MKELEQAGANLEADAARNDLKDLISDLSETTIKHIAENLPGIGLIFKIGKSIQSIRDYETMNKVLSFLHELAGMDKKTRDNLINKINKDPIYGQKFGTFLLTAIDRHDFKEKSVLLARACKYYERGDMSKDNFIRVKTIIEKVENSDLDLWLIRHNRYPSYISESDVPRIAMQKFISLGIVSEKFELKDVRISKDKDAQLTNTSKVIKREMTNIGMLIMYILTDTVIPEDHKKWLRLTEPNN